MLPYRPALMMFLLLVSLPCFGGDAGRPARTVLRVAAPEQDPPLDKTAFRAMLESSPAAILKIRGPQDDLILLLVLDLTGDISLIDAARTALAERLKELPPNTWLAVVKSQDLLQVLVDPTPDRQKVLTAIGDYGATGKSGLLDTLESAAQMGDALLGHSSVRVAVLYLTDSNVYNYREDFTNPVINASDAGDLSRRFPDQLIREKMEKLADVMTGYQTPVFFVHLHYYSDPINEAFQRGLLQVAEESGGSGAFCRSLGEIPASLDKVLTAAQHYWSVGVKLPPLASRTATIHLFNGDRDVPGHTRFALRK